MINVRGSMGRKLILRYKVTKQTSSLTNTCLLLRLYPEDPPSTAAISRILSILELLNLGGQSAPLITLTSFGT